MASKPTILIVHGSYHTSAPYSSLRSSLESLGYTTHCPQLPCSSFTNLVTNPSAPDFDAPPPPSGHPSQSADASEIKALLKTLVEQQGKKVLLVAHSSGGWTATESALPEYQFEVRRKEGKDGGVIGIFYIAAFLIDVGFSVAETFLAAATEPPMWINYHPNSNLTTVKDAEDNFFHDLSPSEARKWSQTLTACPSLNSRLVNDSYAAFPLAYLICEADKILPAAYQEAMVKRVEEKAQRKVEVVRCKGGHEAFLSCEEECVGAISGFAEKCG